MTDITAKRFEDMDTALGGIFVRVRAELGVSSFGMQVVNLPPHFDEPYAAHAHEGNPPDRAFANHGQEEVYVPLRGRATLHAGDEQWVLEPGMAVRVGATQQRNVVTGDEPFQMLALGGTPGRPYAPPRFSEIGAGDDASVG
jgi:mannose-6-phosphate isomerase-like protein (cupin superfamily)